MLDNKGELTEAERLTAKAVLSDLNIIGRTGRLPLTTKKPALIEGDVEVLDEVYAKLYAFIRKVIGGKPSHGKDKPTDSIAIHFALHLLNKVGVRFALLLLANKASIVPHEPQNGGNNSGTTN